MNTLIKTNQKVSDFEGGRILIEDFRMYQHAMIEYFLEVCVKYITNMNPALFTFDCVENSEILTYQGLSNNELTKYLVYVKKQNAKKLLFGVFAPKLVHDNFYYLNGNFYVPLFYIIDKPIIIKEKSVNLASLFSSITFNFDNGICTFTGRNFDLDMFIQAFLCDEEFEEKSEIETYLNLKHSEPQVIDHFNRLLGENFNNFQEIVNHCEKLFFDEYTRYLYESCYSNDNNIKADNLKDIIKISLLMFYRRKIFDFIDLRNKRISFVELLLTPIFKKIANVTYQVNKGHSLDEILFDQYIILKNFHKNDGKKAKRNKATFKSFHGLSGKTLYDIVNLYSSLLIHKASFVKPGMKSPPRSIANIHDSHFGKICPITVSSINPGEMVSIVPEIFVDPFGQFLDLKNN